MRSNPVLILALWGALGALAAVADDTPIDLKTDLKGQYFLVEKGGTAAKPTLVIKRAKPGYNYYVNRELDCAAHTVRTLGEGESLEAMADAPPDPEASPIEPGSIPDQLARLVCPKQ
jgi:hypothetical protein